MPAKARRNMHTIVDRLRFPRVIPRARDFDLSSVLVGAARFELATPCSRRNGAPHEPQQNRAFLHHPVPPCSASVHGVKLSNGCRYGFVLQRRIRPPPAFWWASHSPPP